MLTVDVEHHPDGAAVIAAAGEVDAATAARFSAAVHRQLDRSPRMLVLDLREVTFFGLPGLRVLLCAADRAAAAGVPLRVIYDDPSPVRSALDAAGIAAAFPAAPSPAGATAFEASPGAARGRHVPWTRQPG